MKTRMLGSLEVSAIGMGCMGFSHATGAPTDIDDAAKVVRAAADMGYTFFDTGHNYGFKGAPRHNEELIGLALEGIRDQVVIADKCGVEFDFDVDPDRPPLIFDSSRKAVRAAVEESLRLLRTDYIDIYMQARPDPKVEPEEVAQTYGELIQEGKIRCWGLSEATPDYIERANAVCPISVVENSYNMVNRAHEAEIPLLERHGIGWIAHGPMSKGLLSAAYKKGATYAKDDWRSRQLNDENLERHATLLSYLVELGEEKGATAAQISIAWVLHQKPYIVPIPGMRTVGRLEENRGAADVVLAAEELARIDALLA